MTIFHFFFLNHRFHKEADQFSFPSSCVQNIHFMAEHFENNLRFFLMIS